MSSFTDAEATVTSIQCTVKRICSDKKDRSRQFAFLKPVQGGRDIFAAHNFISQLPSGNGRQFRCEVVGPPQKRSVTRILKSGQPSWKLWQAGQDPLSLPDTEPGSDHGELRFCCAACGTTIVEGHDIFKIKGGAIWTNSTNTMMLPLVDSGSDVWNKFKKVYLRDAYCKCALPNLKVENIGAYYAQEYEDKDASKEGPKKQFPCYKLNYGRKNRNGRIAKLILDAPTRQAAVEQLSLLSNVGADSHKSRINSKTPITNSERDQAQAAKKELYKLQGETKEMELQLNAKRDEAQKIQKYIRQIQQQHVYQQQLQQQQQQVVQQARIQAQADAAEREALRRRRIQAQANAVERREYTQKMQSRLDIEKEAAAIAEEEAETAKKEVQKLQGETKEMESKLAAAKNATGFHVNISPTAIVELPKNRGVATKYVLEHGKEKVSTENWDNIQFTEACTQYMMLTQTPEKPQCVERWINNHLEQQFDSKKAKLRASGVSDDEIWIFHGTSSIEIATNIMKHGMLVAGVDIDPETNVRLPITNGARYGNGVYTSTRTDTPKMYARGGAIILAKALRGDLQASPVQDYGKPEDGKNAWRCNGKAAWMVFAETAQILPVYMIRQ